MGDLYFLANNGTHGNELWKWDGSTATRLTDINPGGGDSEPNNLTVFSGNPGGLALYFEANDSTYGEELWRQSGAAAEPPQPVPTLGKWGVFLTGLVLLGWVRRRIGVSGPNRENMH